ncbi:transposase [Desulfonema magnum]|uniref:Transposase family protein, IS4-like n=1 Tax=Desulfonema magnum TaxID=45655 RepID=A0A975GKT8_9BACT|nr:transposase [Desulfonema magnum]QTA84133.1 Transposase family protein, IS4-like [Desulfonema magnum]
MDQISADDLLIFDLGYSIADMLKITDDKEAFFISRFNYSGIGLYIKKGEEYERIGISEILKKLNGNETIFEFECYTGNKEKKIKIRFFAVRVPEEVANKKRRKMCQNAKKKGRTPKKESLRLCEWNFMMTNIPAEKTEDVRTILAFYPIRWSVELFFKQFKSVLNIHKTEVRNNEDRLRCEVLGKAIVVMFISYCYSNARSEAWRILGEEVSIDKTVKYFRRNIAGLTVLLSDSADKAAKHVRKMIAKITDTCRKERQKSRKNSLDALIDGAVLENYKYVKVNLSELGQPGKGMPLSFRLFNLINVNLFFEIIPLAG